MICVVQRDTDHQVAVRPPPRRGWPTPEPLGRQGRDRLDQPGVLLLSAGRRPPPTAPHRLGRRRRPVRRRPRETAARAPVEQLAVPRTSSTRCAASASRCSSAGRSAATTPPPRRRRGWLRPGSGPPCQPPWPDRRLYRADEKVEWCHQNVSRADDFSSAVRRGARASRPPPPRRSRACRPGTPYARSPGRVPARPSGPAERPNRARRPRPGGVPRPARRGRSGRRSSSSGPATRSAPSPRDGRPGARAPR